MVVQYWKSLNLNFKPKFDEDVLNNLKICQVIIGDFLYDYEKTKQGK